MTINDGRKRRVAEFYSILNEKRRVAELDSILNEQGGVEFHNLFEKSLQVVVVESPPLGEKADDPPVDLPPATGENESPTGGADAEREVKTTDIDLPAGFDPKTNLPISKPESWYCIGSAPLEQQVILESDIQERIQPEGDIQIQERYQAAAAFVSTLIDDTNIPKESEEMRDVLVLLHSIQTFVIQMNKTVSTISMFEKEFIEKPARLGMTQNVVMYLYRGNKQPYEDEFGVETKELDTKWSAVKDKREEVDKNTNSPESVKDSTLKILESSNEMSANIKDVEGNVKKILELLDQTNKTMSMSLSEQAALRARTVREKIFCTVVAFGDKPDESSDSLAFLRDVCEEYRGKTEVIDWVHPKVGMTAAFYAAMCNYPECVEVLVECKANINLRMPPFEGGTSEGWSMLTIAASSKSTACVALLLKLGADVNLSHSKTGQTALHYAMLQGDVVTLNTILATAGSVDLNLKCSNGMSPIYSGLHLLASQSETLKQRPGVLLCISALMDAGASVQKEAFAFAAKKSKCIAALKLMISHPKFDANLLSSYVEGHGTVLYCACEGRNYDGLETLIAAGASANKIPGKFKSSPVIFAISCNDRRAVEILLKQPTLNLELETLESGRKSCLFIAVEKNHLPILSLLVDRLAEGDPNKSIRLLNLTDMEGRTPLLLACQLGLVQHVEKLVSAVGCDVDRSDNQFKTPAFTATEKGFYNVLVALIKANCDLERSCGTYTPLSWIRTKTSEHKFAKEPGEYEFEEEAEDENERYKQIRRLLERKVALPPPIASNCACLIS